MFTSFLLGSAVAYNLVMVIYRLYFHKLSRYPGPRLAAATGLYEIYYSIWGSGIFEDEINEMHRLYARPGITTEFKVHQSNAQPYGVGPVVRINPDEVHVQEPILTASAVDGWIKGTRVLQAGFYHPRNMRLFQLKINTPSIARVRSLLRVEVSHILNGLLEKHQMHRLVSSQLRPFVHAPPCEEKVQPHGESEVEDGDAPCSKSKA
ncbi:uncharacterized protein N7515_008294 [Penicillium bovifimosum]|uniref:Cytochrome P450 n=1 Tax=Penicillium bovifimosum TaxID=126998 RepID=A0A9W9GN52_9EURO|nr:uncharacterized protein N7515_008294 [Penicillium bovifimosum]KAJ5124469.1 hypothetical protein N7515_008294 [Penicillium bovifimosum]